MCLDSTRDTNSQHIQNDITRKDPVYSIYTGHLEADVMSVFGWNFQTVKTV